MNFNDKHPKIMNQVIQCDPFYPLFGGHLTFPNGHLTIPKRAPAELPGNSSFEAP